MSHILAIDQGTSSTKTLMFDEAAKVVARGSVALKTSYLEGGFVEQDPLAIYENVLASVAACITDYKAGGGDMLDIKACGISNQRETFVVWDEQGTPLYNAIVWQCKRSVSICERLKQEGMEQLIREKTGLIADPYFSGTKLIWLYENNDTVRHAIDEGAAWFGTVDSWLLYKLTNGLQYYTDYTNASRTLFFNLGDLNWDRALLAKFNFSKLNLPKVKPSSAYFGHSDFEGILDKEVAIMGMIGDSHAAAFGEGCFSPGTAKAALGTGSSILMNIGGECKPSQSGMISTICWSTEERVDYAMEGVIVTCGATIEWLKNDLQLIADSTETEVKANAVAGNNGVYLVPAFSGLGAPHWDMSRKASITGLTFDCNKNHVVRAALESVAYQVKDVIVAMEHDAGVKLDQLMVDGGLTANGFVMQFLCDLLNRTIVNIGIPDVSALGAAYMAGLKSGVYKNLEHLQKLNTDKKYISPKPNEQVKSDYAGWLRVIKEHAPLTPLMPT